MSDPYAQFRTAPPDPTGLNSLLRRRADLQELHAAQKAALQDTTTQLQLLEDDELPAVMDQLGVQELIHDGLKFAVDVKVSHSVPADRRPAAIAWLEANGHSGLVKDMIEIAFARGRDEEAGKLYEELLSRFPADMRRERWVEPATLGAFVRETYQDGGQLPVDLFGIYVRRFCKITPVK